MRPLLWRRPLGEKLRHAFYLDETAELPFWRSVCKKTCTTIPPGGDEAGGMECGECCAVVAAPALSPAIDLGLPYNDPPTETPDIVYLREKLSPFIYANDHDGAVAFVAGLFELSRNAPHVGLPTEPAGIYTAGQDAETDSAVATLRRWKASIRRQALLEAAVLVERDAHELIRTGYPVQIKLRALGKELRDMAAPAEESPQHENDHEIGESRP